MEEFFEKNFSVPGPDAALRARVLDAAVAQQLRPRTLPRLLLAAASLLFVFGVLAVGYAGQRDLTDRIAKQDKRLDEERRATEEALLQTKRELLPSPIKVLYIEYAPRYEYKYLQNLLKRDPTVLLHVFLASADKDFPQEHSQQALRDDIHEKYAEFFRPLEKLPTTIEELVRYDVILIGDVEPSQLGGPEVQKAYVEYVEKFYGGIVFISGHHTAAKAFQGAPLESLLPALLSDEEVLFEKPRRYILSDDGKKHPILQIDSDPKKLTNLWESEKGVPPLHWSRKAKVRDDAKVLVYTDPNKTPLFAVRTVGRGRVFQSLTDETWRWRFNTGDHPYFAEFWKNVLIWTMR